jgi:hypothetical protein
MKDKANEIIDQVNALDSVDEERRDAMLEKINEWQSDSHAESNSLAMVFEKFWIELEPIFAELGLV